MQSIANPSIYGTPNESQTSRIQEIISLREQQLAQVDVDLLRVRAILEQLLNDRSDIRESLEAHKALIAPKPIPILKRIPPELWAQIFAASVTDAWAASGYPRIEASMPPLLLTQVCSSWREMSFGTPSLWSSICIPKRMPSMAVPLIEMWLQRSGALPLCIEIHGLSSSFSSAILDAFIPFSARWQKVTLFMSNAVLTKLFSNPAVKLSSLENIKLRPSGRPERINISTAHNLRTAALIISRGIRPDPHILDLPWSRLTRLSMTSLAGCIDDASDLLIKCSALTHCSLIATASPWGAAPRSLMRLPNLTYLQLVANHSPGPLLDSLTLPSLSKLEIDFLDLRFESGIWPKTQITSLVERSMCHLDTFILRNKRIPEADLVECCQRIPSLVHLLVTGNGEKRMALELRARRSESHRHVS